MRGDFMARFRYLALGSSDVVMRSIVLEGDGMRRRVGRQRVNDRAPLAQTESVMAAGLRVAGAKPEGLPGGLAPAGEQKRRDLFDKSFQARRRLASRRLNVFRGAVAAIPDGAEITIPGGHRRRPSSASRRCDGRGRIRGTAANGELASSEKSPCMS
jgi:hypothetical protein